MKPVTRQRGIVLLLVILIMLAIGGVAILGTMGSGASSALRSQNKLKSNAEIMAAARAALIGYALNGTAGAGNRPGQLPTPDTLALPTQNYDGMSDASSCLNGAAANGLPALPGALAQVASSRCLGRLPWKQLGLAIDGASEPDVLGIVPWYVVSQNLADPNPGAECMGVLNPVTAATEWTTFSCAETTKPAWPWLKVCDATGKLLSNRVAFVLIIPGELLQTTGRSQLRVRTATGTNPQGYGHPGDFLDAIPTPAGWASLPVAQRCTGYDNAALTGEFVTAPASDSFNDQLIYVTIDELMVEIEKRVALEVSEALKTFRTSYGSYPWLTPVAIPTLASTTTPMVTSTSYDGQIGTNAGLVPLHDFTSSANRFKTELTWNIGGPPSGDIGTFTGNLNNAATEFPCGGGANPTCTCRARVATAVSAIPRTVTTAAFTTIKSGTPNVSAPLVSCQRSSSNSKTIRDNTLTCTAYTITTTTPVTYAIQRRNTSGGNCVTGGTRVYIGDYAGITTRSITLDPTLFTGTASFQAGTSSTHPTRTFTNGSITTLGLLSVTDNWMPTTLGTAPFDQILSTFPTGIITGAGSTAQTTSVILSNVRAYPDFPAWYASQKWNEFMYAAFSPDLPPAGGLSTCGANCLNAGNSLNVNLITISAGAPFAGQLRYSGSPTSASFLEQLNATGATTRTFSSTSQPRNSTYADTVVTLPR